MGNSDTISIKRKIAQLRRWNIASVASAFLGVFIMLTINNLASGWFLVGASLVIAGGAFNVCFWRCPSCHHHLGNEYNLKQCPWCRVTLR